MGTSQKLHKVLRSMNILLKTKRTVLNCNVIFIPQQSSNCWKIFSQMNRDVFLQKDAKNTMKGECE